MAEPDTPESTGNVLESALIDQRMRADRHRANFESLKAQHLTLQEVEYSINTHATHLLCWCHER